MILGILVENTLRRKQNPSECNTIITGVKVITKFLESHESMKSGNKNMMVVERKVTNHLS